MRIFIAGATGVIGVRLIPLLVREGHTVMGMSRSADSAGVLRDLGAESVVCDVFDLDSLTSVIADFRPDVVVHQLTDLPDDIAEVESFLPRNARIRVEGTRNLIVAAGTARIVAQSIAFNRDSTSVIDHEAQVLEAGGVVAQYGYLYGPDTWYPDSLPPAPRIHIDDAARRTVPLLDSPPGVFLLAED